MATNLSVNLNAIALLRNRRDLAWPSVTGIGALALEAGAHGLTVHPRPDERHIRRTDVFELSKMISSQFKFSEFNIEGFPDKRFLELVEEVRPNQVTLVPDDPSQSTSDHGWDIKTNKDMLSEVIGLLKSYTCRVSLFIDAEPDAALQAHDIGADRGEIYTGPYGAATSDEDIEVELEKIAKTAEAANRVGLALNAGHDLTLDNLPALMKTVPNISETSIGHCFTADCLLYGVKETVNRYLTKLGH